jgi:hypothetical protein
LGYADPRSALLLRFLAIIYEREVKKIAITCPMAYPEIFRDQTVNPLQEEVP